MYYQHLSQPNNSDWLRHMINARQMVQNLFSMTRVLKEYEEKMYQPLASTI